MCCKLSKISALVSFAIESNCVEVESLCLVDVVVHGLGFCLGFSLGFSQCILESVCLVDVVVREDYWQPQTKT